MSVYLAAIMAATDCTEAEAEEVEDIMRYETLHSTLDWQTRADFGQAARDAYSILKTRLVGGA